MATALDRLIEALVDGRKDLEDAYSGKTKASATRARKALAAIKDAAQDARKEVLAISKGEAEAAPVDLTVLDVCAEECCDEEA